MRIVNIYHSLRVVNRTVLYIVTFLSFILISLSLFCFAIIAPGNYYSDLMNRAVLSLIFDIIFAILLLINDGCIIFSFFVFIKECYVVLCNRQFKLAQFWHIVLGLYPIIFISFLSSWKLSILIQYFISPIRILFNF